MSLLTSTIIDNTQNLPLVILQSSLAQSCLPILRHLVNNPKPSSSFNLLFCLLYPPSSLADNFSPDTLEIHDWLDRVPGYCDTSNTPSDDLLDIVRKGIHTLLFSLLRYVVFIEIRCLALQEPSRPINIIIDSLDTLLSDKVSSSETYLCLSSIYTLVKSHPGK